MKKVIGHIETVDVIAGGFKGSLKEDGSVEAELQVITGSTNELGYKFCCLPQPFKGYYNILRKDDRKGV